MQHFYFVSILTYLDLSYFASCIKDYFIQPLLCTLLCVFSRADVTSEFLQHEINKVLSFS